MCAARMLAGCIHQQEMPSDRWKQHTMACTNNDTTQFFEIQNVWHQVAKREDRREEEEGIKERSVN